MRIWEEYHGVRGVRLFDGTPEDAVEGATVALVAFTHGNEPVGQGVLARLEREAPDQLISGRVLAIEANQEAARQGLRFTEDGVDLNRLFDRATLDSLKRMPPASLCYEERRALELAPLLLKCDAILDLHSTSQPSEPFLLFRDDQRHAAMACRLGVRRLVTGMHESAIVQGGLISNVGLHPGEPARRLGFTFEAGQHQDPSNVDKAWEVVVRLLHELGLWREVPESVEIHPEIYEVLSRFQQAPSGSKSWVFSSSSQLKLESFEQVAADQVLVRRGATVVRAESPFTMLMPAPDARASSDLYFVAQRRHGGLASGQYRTNAEARREALAIERMLDLLGDDQMQEGASWVTFDSRRCLDLCADLIARTTRMAPEEPHRRITVVGRGDWSGGDAERQNGLRYRLAMRKAIKGGVPIERLQMLRGATLAWLDTLTQSAVDGTVREGGSRVRLRFSARQPNTVSLLVIGDPQLALQEQDFRHCRVGIVIEAATVEPDEDMARVRVVRTCTVSARPEVLRAALGVIDPLRDEHQYLLDSTPWFKDAAVQRLVASDGAIEARPDREGMQALRRTVLRLQLRRWVNALRPELPEPLDLPNNRALGRWLASVMTRTGILDVESLRRLLIRPSGSGWRADLRWIVRLVESTDDGALFELLETGPGRPSPKQPLIAKDVDGDNLERWIGWKRFVRQVTPIAGARGKDLDLVFSEASIRRRLTRWLDLATELAAEAPGEVLVVMAGDGMDPEGRGRKVAAALRDAHRRVLLHPDVRYLRIQHAQGTHLAWMKDVVETLSKRQPGSQPVSVLFEGEHGATVNVVLVCRKVGETVDWSLEGWNIDRCAVIVSDLGEDAGENKLALFTEYDDGTPVNNELQHFGRSHCEGLLKQVGWRASFERGASPSEVLGTLFCRHLSRWVDQVRGMQQDALEEVPTNGKRTSWVANQLGLADRHLAEALSAALSDPASSDELAERVWKDVMPWDAQRTSA